MLVKKKQKKNYHTSFNKKTIKVKTFNFILTKKKKAKLFKIFVHIGVVYNEKKYKKKNSKKKI
jgi:hypothetical protein